VQAVPEDRAAVGGAHLLVRVRQDGAGEEVGRVEVVVAEVARQRSGRDIGARFRDRVHLEAGRAPLRGVEAAREELELRNRVAAEARLPAIAALGHRHFLAIDVELELAVSHSLAKHAALVRNA
jgi:hypothetical protein